LRTVTYKLEDLKTKVIHIGKVAENDATRVQIDAGSVFAEHPAAVPTMSMINPDGTAFPVSVERSGNLVLWDVKDSALAAEGPGEIQFTFTEGNTVVKGPVGRVQICRSIVGDDEAPDPIQDWMTEADAALEEIEGISATAETLSAGSQATASYSDGVLSFGIPQGAQGEPGQDGQDGADGQDGVSPTVAVTTITGGHTVTITDAQGDHAFNVMDGTAGAVIDDTSTASDKVWSASKTNELKRAITPLTPSASASDVGKVLKAKTVADGKVSEYEFGSLPSVPVTDVQVNGSSILSQGVANIQEADSSNHGVVKVNSSYGIKIHTTSDSLSINPATDAQVKEGTSTVRPISPSNQDKAAFYGLAKAAGDTTQASSSNAVGTYTEDAQSKIHDMLNAPVSVSGSTPSITAKAGVRYVCGEVSTLTIVVPASGCIDVTFESGSTATVLTITPPTGQTVKWANGFDPTSLDANTIYELNICDCLGVAGSWA